MATGIGSGRERPRAPAVEVPSTPESGRESAPDLRVETPVQKETPAKEASRPAPAAAPVAPAAPAKDPGLVEVEKILSGDLGEMYKGLPPNVQREFKQKGEEVATKIQEWRRGAKLVASKVLKLIRSWLKIVPRINPFYLEQASKIKADQIMALKDVPTNEETLL